jgi:hypothetical protein
MQIKKNKHTYTYICIHIWAKSGGTGQIRFSIKSEIKMRKLWIVTICGVLFIKNDVSFWFR